jgi:hypothetical protein
MWVYEDYDECMQVRDERAKSFQLYMKSGKQNFCVQGRHLLPPEARLVIRCWKESQRGFRFDGCFWGVGLVSEV